ncbi:MAG: hypothetical protein EA352_02505 [Gemmatimonadales bacterium]|nr:MAG: hypothetical protein EA352_02505 [Gemmatimonadales bacterium]
MFEPQEKADFHMNDSVTEDSVAVDAKRILLRYGVPVAILGDIGEADRIELAREVSRTAVPDRGDRLKELLVEKGYLGPEVLEAPKRKKRRKKKK